MAAPAGSRSASAARCIVTGRNPPTRLNPCSASVRRTASGSGPRYPVGPSSVAGSPSSAISVRTTEGGCSYPHPGASQTPQEIGAPATRPCRGPRSIKGTLLFSGRCARFLQLMAERLQLGAARHLPDEVVQGGLGTGVRAGHPAPFEQDETVAHEVGMLRVVGDEDDTEAGVAGGGHVLQHHAGLLHAERGRRLVED